MPSQAGGRSALQLTSHHTWYLSPRSPTCRWRRNLPCGEISDFNTWNFSTWRGISVFPHNRCGEMWIFAKFGEISHFSTGQMWRNLKFIQFFVIKSVLRCFCEIRFGAIYALLRGENFCKKLGRWRKNDKYQVCPQLVSINLLLPDYLPQPRSHCHIINHITSHHTGIFLKDFTPFIISRTISKLSHRVISETKSVAVKNPQRTESDSEIFPPFAALPGARSFSTKHSRERTRELGGGW